MSDTTRNDDAGRPQDLPMRDLDAVDAAEVKGGVAVANVMISSVTKPVLDLNDLYIRSTPKAGA